MKLTGVIAMMMGLAASGCVPIAFKGPARESSNVSSATRWPFVPVAMRVHPFTGFAKTAEGLPVVEARLELLDQQGDVTKGVGQLRFELYAEAAKASRGDHARRLAHWNVALDTLALNAQHWDPITRTYVFRLKLAEAPTEDQPLSLSVQFTLPGGKRLRAEGKLTYQSEAEQ